MPDIKEQKLIYHLTSLENMSGILASGLLPRAHLQGFEDVADQEIIDNLSLELEVDVNPRMFL